LVVAGDKNIGTRGAGSIFIEKYGAYLNEAIIEDLEEIVAENIRLTELIEETNRAKESLEFFFANTKAAVTILDRDYNFVRVNKSYARADSRDVSDYPGHNYFAFYPHASRDIFDQVVETKEAYQVSARPFSNPDPTKLAVTYWDWSLTPFLNASGAVEFLIVTANEVTDNVSVQDKLLESEERYRAIFNNSLDGILLTTPDGEILSANPSACRMLGRTEEELRAVGRNGIVDFSNPSFTEAMKERAETGRYIVEVKHLRKDGTQFDTEITSNLFKDSQGLILSSTIVRDITERKKIETALRLSEAKFSKAFHNSQTMMAIRRLKDEVYIDVNQSYAEVLGYDRQEMIGKSVNELELWADEQERREMQQLIAGNDYIANFESKFKKKTGEIGYALYNVTLFDIGNERYALTSATDVTEMKQTREGLLSSKELFYKTFNANPQLMAITIKNGMFLEINETFVKRYGYTREETIGFTVEDIDLWVNINERLKYIAEIEKKGFVENFETKYRNKAGEILTVLLSGVSIVWNNEQCILTIANDISELRRYQQEVARLNQLHLVGEMSAGIGHEIRNPMTAIRGFLQILGGKDRYAEDKVYMDLMIEELDRINAIITEFLMLAKDKAVEKKRQSLNQEVKAIFPLLQAEAMKQEKNIDLQLEDIPHLVIDKHEIIQLILNLAHNGLEAMSPGGHLSIKTFRDAAGVVLAVQDQGSGIAPEVLEKIGTPFFTTKDYGTGLGLAVCYSIAQRHNARIDIETGAGGTTFCVRFKNG